MKKKKRIVLFSVILAVLIAVGVGAYAVSNLGSESDPLVTLSYLNDVVKPELMEGFRTELRSAQSRQQVSSSFEVVSLSDGEMLVCPAGTELIPRSGAASISEGAAVDSTGGRTLAGGSALPMNHLCIADTDGLTALADGSVTLLIRGAWSVE